MKACKSPSAAKGGKTIQQEVHGNCTSIHKRLNYRKTHFQAYTVTHLRLSLSLSIHLLSHHSRGSSCARTKIPTHLKVLMVLNFEDISERRPMTQLALRVLSLYLKAGHHHSAVHSGRPGRHTVHSGSRTVHSDKISILHRFLVYSDKNCCFTITAQILARSLANIYRQ